MAGIKMSSSHVDRSTFVQMSTHQYLHPQNINLVMPQVQQVIESSPMNILQSTPIQAVAIVMLISMKF
jgi:hypothetical protein